MTKDTSKFIEAEGVREAASGGVKNNPLDPTGKIRAVDYDKDVYGNVPYHRVEYTAARIVAYFNFDLALLHGYRLPSAARELLIALGLYKIRRFLSYGLRLRTACDLETCGDLQVTKPQGFTVPDESSLLAAVKERIARCREEELFRNPPVTELTTTVVMKEKTTPEAETEEVAAAVDTDSEE